MIKKQDTVKKEAPGLGEIEAFFPPTSASDAALLAANVSMKLPAFWPDAAEVWFAQADAQLTIRNITVSKTKFYHAVAVLPQKVALQILDLIRAPPAGDPYGVLPVSYRSIRWTIISDLRPWNHSHSILDIVKGMCKFLALCAHLQALIF